MSANDNSNQSKKPLKGKQPQVPKFNFYWIYAIIAVAFLVTYIYQPDPAVKTTWQRVKSEMLLSHDVARIVVVNDKVAEVYIKKEALTKDNPKYKDAMKGSGIMGGDSGPHYYFEIGDVGKFDEKMEEVQKDFAPEEKIELEYTTSHNAWGEIFSWIIPLLLIFGFWMLVMRRMGGGGGGGAQIFNIGRSRAQLYDKDMMVNITFKDVAGLDEAKQEVMEIVDFLQNPKKYTNLGGKIPKGALLVGPPGTGKTLLAKAVAGEAGVPFFSLSGSDFVEMFVGVGASRVRDLFKQAKEKSPCIIFIDEIDAIGRARGRNMIQGGNDERENTLNQLLTEMDGFGTDSGVIILAATNRPDILDTALLRPGRFDRQISVDKPDLVGREAIFRVHLKPIKVDADVDAKKLSAQTPGFAGADIANVCNESALIAARKNKQHVDMQDFQDAIDRVIGGLEKKNKLISPEEKKIVAYHEAGHAIAGWFLEHADPLVKVSIVPRGVAALGYAQYLPKEQYLYTVEQLMDEICMTLGGRVAEDIIFGRISTGAQNDLERITKVAYAMVTIYGMNPRVGNLSFNDPQGEYGFSKPYSDKTSDMIDEEVRNLVNEAYQRTKQMLLKKRDLLDKLAKILLEKEIIFQTDLEQILGKRPFDHKTTYEEYMTADDKTIVTETPAALPPAVEEKENTPVNSPPPENT